MFIYDEIELETENIERVTDFERKHYFAVIIFK